MWATSLVDLCSILRFAETGSFFDLLADLFFALILEKQGWRGYKLSPDLWRSRANRRLCKCFPLWIGCVQLLNDALLHLLMIP